MSMSLRSHHYLVGMLAMLFIALAASVACAQGRSEIVFSRNARMSRLMLDPKYHEAVNLSEAAAQMLCDASAEGFDIQERPEWYFSPIVPGSTDSASFHVGCRFQDLNVADRSMLDHLTFASDMPDSDLLVSAFVHLEREPSIGQVADLLRSGTRFLSWRGNGYFVVAGSERSFRKLARESLADWIQQIMPGQKRKSYSSGCILGEYLITAYFPIPASFEDDLRRLGLDVVPSSRWKRFVNASGTEQAADAAANLWWVECISYETWAVEF